MDEGTRTRGPAVGDGAARGPAEIREDIAQTREQLGETVEALAAKTDVKSQARAKVEDARDVAETKVAAARRVLAANPVPFGVLGALAAGLLLRRMIRRR
ncbi:MAG: hypothetical protein QOJ85_1571 [Solirubrobacteraceae bacterium]|jgi:hypothetical protein|nr:hypothetical protein [Solirubrobacteraceae bacterium]